jgi:hypothetical protein
VKIKERVKGVLVFVFIGVGVLGVLVLIVSSFSGLKKNFHKELAKRLETEEAMLKMENERARLLSQIENLKKDLALDKEKIVALSDEMAQEQEGCRKLAAECDKLKPVK